MSMVLVSDGFVGLEQTATLENNSFMMTVARASSFAEKSTERDFTGEKLSIRETEVCVCLC